MQDENHAGSLRLTGLQWAWTAALVAATLASAPWLWRGLEKFTPAPDYRIPYSLSDDYWLYQRRVAAARKTAPIFVVGDSVVWGEYVLPDGTLSHFLNQQAGSAGHFVNAGVNGLFPLALEGLIEYYGQPISHQKVLLHANLLWMSSPKADLNVAKEEKFNHAELVPQFRPRIPCYKADIDTRLGALVRRQLPFFGWVEHLQDAYFDQHNIVGWTLILEDGEPPRHPNAYRNPLAQIKWLAETAPDPERGPASARHRPWSEAGMGRVRFDWVDLNGSLQWGALRRLVALLRDRGDEVFVVVGPFNEHLLMEENVGAYRQRRDAVVSWLEEHNIAHLAPPPLPSELYADASHPLTEGYARLAATLMEDEGFRRFARQRAKE